MKRKIMLSLAALMLLCAVLIPGQVAHAEIVNRTRLRVIGAEDIDEGSFKVFYGPTDLFQQGRVLDATAAAATDRGIEYIPPGSGPSRFNLYIVAGENHVITSVSIVDGFVERYRNGRFTGSNTVLDISNPDLVVLTGEELDFRDGQNMGYIEQGGAKERNIPQDYTGSAYFGAKVGASGTWTFTLKVTTERANSGSVTLEESKTGLGVSASYTLNYGSGTITGTAEEVNASFNKMVDEGQIKAGTQVEIAWDPSWVGDVLVRKGESGYDDPKEPDWTLGQNKISFTLDKTDRVLRFLYFTPPGSVRIQYGTNPLGFTTNVDVAKGSDGFSGTLDEVNEFIAKRIFDGKWRIGDTLTFTIQDPTNVIAVRQAPVLKDAGGRESVQGDFGVNILQGRGFSVTLAGDRGYRVAIGFRGTPGRLFVQESIPNKGTFEYSVFTGATRVFFIEDTAEQATRNLDLIIGSGEAKIGSTINITFPEDIQAVRKAVGSQPSVDITDQIVNRVYSYTETEQDVFIFVLYKNSGSEFVITPTQPQSPDVPPPGQFLPPDFTLGGGMGAAPGAPGAGNGQPPMPPLLGLASPPPPPPASTGSDNAGGNPTMTPPPPPPPPWASTAPQTGWNPWMGPTGAGCGCCRCPRCMHARQMIAQQIP